MAKPVAPEFEFLLDHPWPNLFEAKTAAWDRDPTDLRCKGCGEDVRLWQAERHYNHHLRQQIRQREARAAQVARERGARLARARAAKAARAAA